jgi:hypothetical protein
MAKQITIPNTLTLEACEFLAPSPTGEAVQKAACKMTARSGRPINVPGVGQVIHDLAGMRQPAERLNVDYCHNQSELIGYCEKLSADTGDLACVAQIFSVRAGDRAEEVLARAKEGQPYQCSIKWDDGKFERIVDGQCATINGRQFSGPGVVVRQWTLRGVAVCPYGADPNTAAEFAAQSLQTFTLPEESMTTETQTPEAKTPETIRAELQAQAQDYVKRFGDLGGQWFAAGKPLVECYGEFVQQLAERHQLELQAEATRHAGELAAEKTRADGLQAKITELTARVESLGNAGGATTPVSGAPAAGDGTGGAVLPKQPLPFEMALGNSNLAAIARGMKMPSAE